METYELEITKNECEALREALYRLMDEKGGPFDREVGSLLNKLRFARMAFEDIVRKTEAEK